MTDRLRRFLEPYSQRHWTVGGLVAGEEGADGAEVR